MILILKGVHGDLHLIDPTIEEENVCNTVNPQGSENRGLATLAYLGNLKQVTLQIIIFKFSPKNLIL